MTVFWKLLLVSLLSTPSAERLAGCLPATPLVRDGLRQAAVDLELIGDGKPATSWFREHDVLVNEVRLLRERVERTKDCPPLRDVRALPSHETVQSWLQFHDDYQAYVRRCYLAYDATGRRDEAKEHADALDELTYARAVWGAAGVAVNETFDVMVRRQALRELRNLLGARYYTRDFPCPVPVHRFSLRD